MSEKRIIYVHTYMYSVQYKHIYLYVESYKLYNLSTVYTKFKQGTKYRCTKYII